MSLLFLAKKRKFTPAVYSPLSLFAASEQGAWYDPSDLSSMFTERVGTGAMSAVGTIADQPVGLMLDKSKGLALGAELVVNGTFDADTNWTKASAGWSIVGGTLNYLGTGNNYEKTSQPVTTKIGTTYRVTFNVTAISSGSLYLGVGGTASSLLITPQLISTIGTYSFYFSGVFTTTYIIIQDNNGTQTFSVDNISVKEIAGNHAVAPADANRPKLSARVNLLLATATLATQSVTTAATSYKLAFDGAGTVTLSGTATGVLSAGTNTFTATAGTLTLTVSGSGSVTLADVRPTNSGALLPAYQRVNTASDYDTVGFPLYLKCDGTSSAMSTSSIDFTSTDKMTVVTGGRKLSNAGGMTVELSQQYDLNQGAFMLYDNVSGLRTGTSYIEANLALLANINYVRTSLFDGSLTTNAKNKYRLNGALQSTSYSGNPAGTSYFGTYPLFLFTRNNAPPYNYNGNFYGAIIRGATTDTAALTSTENWMATKTGITF